MSPTWLIIILIVVMLTYSGFLTGNRALVTWQEENRALSIQEIEVNEEEWLLANGQSISTFDYLPAGEDLELEYEQIRESEADNKSSVLFILLLMIITTTFTLIRGGHPTSIIFSYSFFHLVPSIASVRVCTPAFWIWSSLQVIALMLFSINFASVVSRQFLVKQKLNVHRRQGELQWTALHSFVYPALSIITGFFGGMLGLGGAIFSNPMLIALGMIPTVVIATSATAIVYCFIFTLVILAYFCSCCCIKLSCNGHFAS